MKVSIDINKKTYEFIDGSTGEKISAEEFAKRYPGVGLAGYAVGDGKEEGHQEANPNKE